MNNVTILEIIILLLLFSVICVLFLENNSLKQQVDGKQKTSTGFFSGGNEVKQQNLEKTVEEQQQKIFEQENKLAEQQKTIATQQKQMQELQSQISVLSNQVNALNLELGKTSETLQETQTKLNVAENYQERVNQGINRQKAYLLLSDIDSTRQLMPYITQTTSNPSDQEIWQRAKDIYNWMGKNFKYTGDRAICIGNDCVQFQYWSPDELLSLAKEPSKLNQPTGDCDDFAQLFAGMMLASNVPNEKVLVVCGNVPSGGHCWNSIKINDKQYYVDPVCSNATNIINFFGLQWNAQTKTFPTNPEMVLCFSSYMPTAYYNQQGYWQVN